MKKKISLKKLILLFFRFTVFFEILFAKPDINLSLFANKNTEFDLFKLFINFFLKLKKFQYVFDINNIFKKYCPSVY